MSVILLKVTITLNWRFPLFTETKHIKCVGCYQRLSDWKFKPFITCPNIWTPIKGTLLKGFEWKYIEATYGTLKLHKANLPSKNHGSHVKACDNQVQNYVTIKCRTSVGQKYRKNLILTDLATPKKIKIQIYKNTEIRNEIQKCLTRPKNVPGKKCW